MMMGEPLPDSVPDVDQWEAEPGKFDEPDEGPMAGEPEAEPEADEPKAEKRKDGRAKCPHILDARAVCTLCGLALGLDVEGLHDATVVAARGRAIADAGVPWLLEGIIPAYGMLGMLVAYAKVGKTTFGHALGAAVSRGVDFLGGRRRGPACSTSRRRTRPSTRTTWPATSSPIPGA